MGEGRQARRRLVLYVHGLDPRGPSAFHAFQQQAAAADSLRPDRSLALNRRERDPDGAAWTVDADWPEGQVRTRFIFLGWDDLVRARWRRGLWSQFTGLCDWFGRLTASGAIGRAGRRRTMVLAFFALPFAILIFLLGLAAAVALTAWGLSAAVRTLGLSPWLALSAAALLFAAPFVWRRIDAHLNLCWLGQGYGYLVDLSRDRVQGLDARLDAQARRLVRESQTGDWNEILIVGHSCGAANAAFLIGRALDQAPTLGEATPVSFLTLGHNLTAYALMGLTPPHAADLDRLVAARRIPWLNVTTPSDPAASDWPPLAFTAHGQDQGRVASRSPRFHLSMTPDAYRVLRRDPFTFHFHYMAATDDPARHDWFRLIAGPDRFSAEGRSA